MPIRRRPSAATLVALVVTLAIGTQASLAASSSTNDRSDPRAVSSVEVTAADASSVTIAWPPSRFDWKVAGYGVYVDGAKVATVTPDRVQRWRNTDSLSYTVQGLTCGRGYTIGVDVFDREDDRSEVTSTTVSTSACPDTAAPSPPAGMRQIATTESSVMLAWTPSSDNVGVVEYGLYDSGLRVATVSEPNATVTNLACGKTYLLGIDAADAAGNRSTRIDSYFRTSACPSTNKPPSTPTVVKVGKTTETTVALSWTASTDDVGVTGYGLYLSGWRTNETTGTTGEFTGLKCGTTYTLGVDAKDAEGKRSAVASISTATSPCSTTPPPPTDTGAVTQTIANGQTITDLVNWRGVYDKNGDKVEDDPGKIQFLVDGNLVLSEELIPFGDSFADGSITTSNGTHTFEVRALNDSGTLLAKNTVTATINNQTTPSPPTGDKIAPSQPSNLKVTSAAPTGVTLAWSPSTDNVAVTGYGLYRGTSRMGTTPQTNASFNGLTCGTGYQVGVDAFDAAGNSSSPTNISVTTTPCADTQAPTAPTNVTVSTRSTTSISLTWAPSTDNMGVVGYELYRGGVLVGQTAGTTGIVSGLTCGTNYTLGINAYDAAGNDSAQTIVMISTLPCADTTTPTAAMTSPANGSTVTGTVNASANASDNVGVTRVEFFRDGVSLGSDTNSPYSIAFDTTTIADGSHTFNARAYDSAGNVGSATNVTVTVANATPPPGSTGTVAQTIANGQTITDLVNWRGVYDKNGDKVEDDPGSIQFLVDGKQVLSEINPPFGDSFADGSITTSNGTHTFEVRALNDSGTLLAKNTVTATINNQTTPPPPPPSGGTCPLPAYPDGTCTGVPPGTTLTPSGGLTITVAGTVINGRDITGQVVVNASNVTIRNTRIRSNAMWVIDNDSTGLLVEDSEIINRPVSGQPNCHNGIGNSNFTVRRTEITGCENAMNVDSPGNVTFEDNYVHDLDTAGPSYVWGNDTHTDGLQVAANNVVIRHNSIDPVGASGGSATSGIILNTDSPNASVWIEDNYIDGRAASYAIYAPRQQTHDVYINRNRMYQAKYGYTACVRLGITVTQFNENRDAGTGALISPDNGAGGGCTN